MPCRTCEAARRVGRAVRAAAIEHATRLKLLKAGRGSKGEANGPTVQDAVEAEPAAAAPEGVTTAGQAADAPVPYRRRRVAIDTGEGAGTGREHVQGVRPSGDGEAGAR